MLETTFTTPTGVLVLRDVMPTGDGRADLVRTLRCSEGSVRVRHEWVVRFDYGLVRPWVTRQQVDGQEVIVATAGPDKLMLRGPRLPQAVDGHHADEFDLAAGESMTFSTTWVRSWHQLPEPLPSDDRIEATRVDDERWALTCMPDVPHADLVRRSLLTLRLMTHAETGGIVAAPTTSLPEEFGGERNWDYRYCWLRDAALTLESLLAPATPRRPAAGATGCCARSPATRRTCRSCTASTAAAGCPSASWTTWPGTPAPARSASATARSASARPTCWAR